MTPQKSRILIDAVFFQYNRSGIARVWLSLLREWAGTDFSNQLLVLDRQGTAPRIEGIAYRQVPAHNYAAPEQDAVMLQAVCDEEQARLFISSYYTTPLHTQSVFMVYDMIPEMIGWDIQANAMWRQKHVGILHAHSYISISRNTAKDLHSFYPSIDLNDILVAHCGVDFVAQIPQKVDEFKKQHGIDRPYFLLVGSRADYKNGKLFFDAFALLGNLRQQYAVVCTGPWAQLEPEFAACVGPAALHMIEVNDAQLQCAYSGAIALAYPSKYEGFGMPITEAMACGCPVITCKAGSIPEVAGDSVIYVDISDPAEMARALLQVQDPVVRERLIASGFRRSKQFTWHQMAQQVRTALLDTAEHLPKAPQPTTSDANASKVTNMLTQIIPPEITNDTFYQALHSLAQRSDLHHFLEIGSSSGGGSTQAFASGIQKRTDSDMVKLYCMELSKERFAALANAYKDHPFVHVYNQSSVRFDEFPSEQEVNFFYQHTRTNLNQYPLSQVTGWLRQDLDYMKQSGLTANGIEIIKTETGIKHFDMVLIDGSEFTGEAELYHVLGARVIALDDVNSFKCFNAYRVLSNHTSYAMTHQDLQVRNGFAIFQRRF
jgi:glycosyltransferase involved in cell wall biosynthesis